MEHSVKLKSEHVVEPGFLPLKVFPSAVCSVVPLVLIHRDEVGLEQVPLTAL